MKIDSDIHISIKRDLSGKKKLCPKCLSTLKDTSPLGGWITPHYYRCEACGYYGAVALEADETSE